jgi:hypothetical protein
MEHQTIQKRRIENLRENILNIWHPNVEPARLPQIPILSHVFDCDISTIFIATKCFP